MIPHSLPGLLGRSVGLVLPSWGLFGCDPTPMASSQRLPNRYNSRFTVTLKYEGVARSPGISPGLQFLVHILYQPTIISFTFSYTYYLSTRPP